MLLNTCFFIASHSLCSQHTETHTHTHTHWTGIVCILLLLCASLTHANSISAEIMVADWLRGGIRQRARRGAPLHVLKRTLRLIVSAMRTGDRMREGGQKLLIWNGRADCRAQQPCNTSTTNTTTTDVQRAIRSSNRAWERGHHAQFYGDPKWHNMASLREHVCVVLDFAHRNLVSIKCRTVIWLRERPASKIVYPRRVNNAHIWITIKYTFYDLVSGKTIIVAAQ